MQSCKTTATIRMAACHLPTITCNGNAVHSSSPPFLTVPYVGGRHLRWAGTAFVCSAKKSRAAKKAKKLPKPNMSDDQLCEEIRQFVSAEGLPQNHVPSMTELAKRGRKDLANIVRRKGYKLVAEILKHQTNVKIQSDINEQPFMNKINGKIHSNGNEVFFMNPTTDEIQSGRRDIEHVDDIKMDTESKKQEELKDNSEINKVNFTNQTNCILQSESNGEHPKNQTEDKIKSERSLLQNLDMSNNNLESPGQQFNSQIISNEDRISETNLNQDIIVPNGSMVRQEAIPSSSKQFSLSCHSGENGISIKDDNDIIYKVGEVVDESEISGLKIMLRKKEMDLLLLKQEIEKEKLALSKLRETATAEIRKVHSLVLAKDSELQAAEEALHGLKEVLIEYHASGQSVEITGSFNGWHHRVKMENHPSLNAQGLPGIRESNRWTTTLWLYPGIYEIKFVVDGDWRVDSQREMHTKGHFTNNILRVER